MVKILTRTERIITLIAYLLPISILLLIFYLNFLPFGYKEKKIINVGHANDTMGTFYLNEDENLGKRESVDGESFRFIQEAVYAIYEPKFVLKNMSLEISVDGENLYLPNQPTIDFDWEHNWDSNNILNSFYGIVMEESSSEKVKFKNDCLYLDGNRRFVLPGTTESYATGPFAIYIEWVPEKKERAQQIVGKYNWEIFQNEDNVTFQIGITNEGSFYNVTHQITDDFFNEKHTLLAIYNPSSDEDKDGYIELFIDDLFADRTYIGKEKIDPTYGGQKFTIGWSSHNDGKYPKFKGSLCSLRFTQKELQTELKDSIDIFVELATQVKIPILGDGKLRNIELNVEK